MSGRVHVTVTISQARWLSRLADQLPDIERVGSFAPEELPVIESIARAARRALDWKERRTRESKE